MVTGHRVGHSLQLQHRFFGECVLKVTVLRQQYFVVVVVVVVYVPAAAVVVAAAAVGDTCRQSM